MKPKRASHPAPAPAASGAGGWNSDWIRGIALVLLTVLAFLPALHAGFIWDDDVYVTENPLLSAPGGWSRIWFSLHRQSQYFPLAYSTFRLEYTLWGLNPIGYHLVNILVHAGNAILAWTLLRRLRAPGAWLAAATFAIHPVQVETVAWVTELKNTESTCFYLLALLSWFHFISEETHHRWRWYALALGAALLALLAKTTACTLPAALLLMVWWKQGHLKGRNILQIVPFALVGAAMGALSIWWEHYMGHYTSDSTVAFSWGHRLIMATRAIWFYAGKVVWPVNLAFSYDKWPVQPNDLTQYVWLAGCLIVAGLLWYQRQRVGRGLIAGILFFVATLSPLLGFIWVYTFRYAFVADHYQYLACLGLIAVIVAVATQLTQRWKPPLRAVAAACLLLVLGTLTWCQAATYKDAETLWRSTVVKSPNSWMVYNNLGAALVEANHLDEARPYLEKGLTLNPSEPNFYNNLGIILQRQGKPALAITNFLQALALDPNGPSTHNNLGNVYRQLGQLDEAERYFNNALQLDPYYAVAHNNLGFALSLAGRPDDALVHFEKALELQPDYASAHNNLANLLFQVGQEQAALAHYLKALKLRPNYPDAHNNLGVLLLRNGRAPQAIAEWKEAIRSDPQYLNARDNLAWVLSTHPDPKIRLGSQALALARETDELCNHANPKILRTLAAAYAENGLMSEALSTAQTALPMLQTESRLAQSLRDDIALYQAGQPRRDNSQAGVPPAAPPP